MTSKQIWHLQSGITEVQFSEKEIEQEFLLVNTKYSFISQGTEKLVKSNNVPSELWEEMRVPYMQGGFGLPIHYGYSLVGEVLEGPAEWIGKEIHAMHPHSDYFMIRPDDAFDISGKDLSKQVLISNAETALNAIWDGEVKPGNSILIAGLGSVGILVGAIASAIPGVSVSYLELNNSRKAIADKLGWNEYMEGTQYDIAFHTTGSFEGLEYCVESVGFEGAVIELSWYGTKEVPVSLGKSFHSMRKKIVSSQVSHISKEVRGSWDYSRRKQAVSTVLEKVELPSAQLLSIDQACNWFNGDSNADNPFLIIDYDL